jgi:GDP-mannose 6-dehydrogenase
MVLATGARQVAILGMTFKAGTDDLRESPVVTLIEQLHGKGVALRIYDRDVKSANLIGANKEYIEREIPHIWTLMHDTVADTLAGAGAVVIGNSSREFREIAPLLTDGQMVIDLVRAFPNRVSGDDSYRGISW